MARNLLTLTPPIIFEKKKTPNERKKTKPFLFQPLAYLNFQL